MLKSNRRLRGSLAVAIACAAVGSAQTQPATEPATMPASQPTTQATTRGNGRAANGEKFITPVAGGLLLNFKDASIDVVLDELSSSAGFIVIKDVRPEGKITLVSKTPVSGDDAAKLLNTVLNNAGYAAIQRERVLRIVRKDAAKRANIPVRSGNDPSKVADTDELITQVIPLRYADAQQLKQDLSPLLSTDADFTSNQSSNVLVITDTSSNVRRLVQIVAALDTSVATAADVKVFQLKYADASAAAKLINDVFQEDVTTGRAGSGTTGRNNNGGGRGQGGGGGGGFGGGGGGFGGGGGGFGGGPGGGGFGQRMAQIFGGGQNAQDTNGRARKVNAAADDRTNAVVVTGPTDTIAVIANVIKELDANPAAEQSVFVYRLKNAQSLNVESVLNSLFNGTSVGTRGTNSNASNNRSTRTNAVSNRTGAGSRTGSRSGGSNATGGFGTGTNGGQTQTNRFGNTAGVNNGGGTALSSAAQSAANDLAGQVTIIADPDTNTLLVRTAPKNYDQVKIVLDEIDRPTQQVLIKVLIAEVTHSNTQDIGAELSVLNLRASGNGQRAGTNFGIANLSSGLVVQFLETDFTATIRALEQQGKLDVLSRPYILASDNQLASITVGQEVPFITNTRVTDTGQTINTIEYDDIGILLDVVPHINPEGLVIMDVAPEISALTGDTVPISDGVSAPVFAKRSAESRVAVRNGQTVVIGGLMEDRKTETVNKVPILGDIPFIGNAFRRKIYSKTKTELLIFLTPNVAAMPDLLPKMGEEELRGTQLAPNAVAPGEFQNHMNGLKRGSTTEPSEPPPPISAPPEPPLRAVPNEGRRDEK